jgi:spermidine synthase
VKIPLLSVGLAVGLAALLLNSRLAWNEELLFQGHYSFKSLEAMESHIGDHATSERYKGEQDVLSISRRNGKSYFFINGKISINLEDASEKIVGAISGVFAENHRRAMVLGVGSGATAGAVGLLFDEVNAVEISGVILENLPRLEEHNFGIAQMPNVSLIHDDAIHAVRLSEGGYSLILNTVTSPLFFSSSKLYTVEFLQNVRSKLAPGGLYMTWLDSRVGDRGADIMLESVTSNFEHCGLAQLGSDYLLMLCSDRPIVAHHPMAVAEQPQLAAYFRDKHGIDPAGIAYQLINTDAAALANSVRAPLNTLDYPVLEFEMARLRKRSLANLRKRIIASLNIADLGKAFRHFDWSLESMLSTLKTTNDTSVYYRKVKLEHFLYRTYVDAGLTAQRRGDCKMADSMMTRALAMEGKVANRNLLLGHCYAMQGMYREALHVYARELQVSPEKSRINLLMARVNIGLQRLSVAHDQLQQVAAEERDAAYHYLMAEVLAAQNSKVEAESHYAEAMAQAGSLEAAADSVQQLTVE